MPRLCLVRTAGQCVPITCAGRGENARLLSCPKGGYALDLYRCESPECDFVTANPDLEQCPVCGGAFFVPATEEEVAPHGWFYLSQEAARAHRETDAYAASARGAALGDAACQCEQGRRLHEGRGVARDQAAAAACFEAAAAQNSPDGQCLLGLCHEKGEGVPQSWENAAFLYRQAADQGFAPALSLIHI